MAEHVPGGYNGKVLRVDLTNGKATTEQIDDSFCRKYLGGTGFIAYYLLRELKEGIDPLGIENKLVFAMGPLTGLTLGGCARHAVGAKSPLTGGIAKSEVGEYWGAQFKRAGFDVLIIEGKAESPVYLGFIMVMLRSKMQVICGAKARRIHRGSSDPNWMTIK